MLQRFSVSMLQRFNVMPKYSKKPEILLKQRLKILKEKGIKEPAKDKDFAPLEPLESRVQKVLNITKDFNQNSQNMIFLVMYDIEDNKVRTEIAKYLIRKGCIRIQKSVYMANLDRKVFREIHQTLKEIQEMYENNDSLLLVPVSVDEVRNMKIIGQKIDTDLILGNRNTLFF